MHIKSLLFVVAAATIVSCNKNDVPFIDEDASTFAEISSIKIGETGAAEITAYDPSTKRLFVVTNAATTKIDILNLADPALPEIIGSISIAPYGAGVNSVSVYDGKLAAAVEGPTKTDPGSIVVFKTSDYFLIKQIPAGALPDMVTFSPDGKYILSANEGEPNDAYTIDPIGSVTIVSVKDNYSATTIDFASFAGQETALKAKGFRIFGPAADFAKNIEPEYIAVSSDSRTAWVTLQENNGIATIDIRSKKFTNIFPLGFKNYNLDENAIDPSDKAPVAAFAKWPVKGMYQPDAIAVFETGGTPYLFTANEGDVREWAGFAENKRVKDLKLDETAFPAALNLKTDEKLGRLNVTTTLGDTDNDGDYDELYSFGARSFSVWNGWNGELVFDSKNDLEKKCLAASLYDDARSDDKGVEPEGVAVGQVGRQVIAFVGMERSDAVGIYAISAYEEPKFIKLLKSGDAPEGITFIQAKNSPVKKSLLIVSSENDGVIKIYKTN